MASPASASVCLGGGKGCFKSLFFAAAAAKTSCEQSSWSGCSGEGQQDNEGTMGLAHSKFRFYPQKLSVPPAGAAGSAARASPSCDLQQGQQLEFFLNICV